MLRFHFMGVYIKRVWILLNCLSEGCLPYNGSKIVYAQGCLLQFLSTRERYHWRGIFICKVLFRNIILWCHVFRMVARLLKQIQLLYTKTFT